MALSQQLNVTILQWAFDFIMSYERTKAFLYKCKCYVELSALKVI
jgi:hypothetical protein